MERIVCGTSKAAHANYRRGKRQCVRKTDQLKTKDTVVLAIQSENIIVDGTPVTVERIFAQGPDSGLYFKVGWILFEHVTHCMICNKSFGIMLNKHHCKACGNVVCSYCGPEKGTVIVVV